MEGWLRAVVVTAASIGDRAGAKLLIIRLLDLLTLGALQLIWADAGYDGKPLAAWARAVADLTVQIIKRTELHVFGGTPPVGGGAHLRLAASLPQAGARL